MNVSTVDRSKKEILKQIAAQYLQEHLIKPLFEEIASQIRADEVAKKKMG